MYESRIGRAREKMIRASQTGDPRVFLEAKAEIEALEEGKAAKVAVDVIKALGYGPAVQVSAIKLDELLRQYSRDTQAASKTLRQRAAESRGKSFRELVAYEKAKDAKGRDTTANTNFVKWEPALHPRDRRGRFLDVPGR